MIRDYDNHGNRRNPSKHVTPKPSWGARPIAQTSAEQPEGNWMCVDCETVKDRTLMATWIPDMFTMEGLPTGSCKGCNE